MYRFELNDSNQIRPLKDHVISYDLEGSLPNPLEAAYTAFAGGCIKNASTYWKRSLTVWSSRSSPKVQAVSNEVTVV